jgi:RNA polymerase sigma-70 factor (ECF subfamily)
VDAELESRLRATWQGGDRAALVTQVIQGYGREILGYLLATLRGDGEAGDAFSQFSLNLWEAAPGFRGDSAFRTWAYALARHAAGRVIRERGRQRRQVALSSVPEIEGLVARVRSETVEWLRTGTRDRVARVRDGLDADDRLLLILRVDRGFSWPEIAQVLCDDAAPPSAEAQARQIVSLRKRFERLKERIRRLAQES